MRLTEEQVKKELNDVARFPENADKLSWRRKMNKMEQFLKDLEPIEEEIFKLYEKKQPIMDKISKLRQIMVDECIHPKDHLVHKGTHIECKFCNKIIKPVRKNG